MWLADWRDRRICCKDVIIMTLYNYYHDRSKVTLYQSIDMCQQWRVVLRWPLCSLPGDTRPCRPQNAPPYLCWLILYKSCMFLFQIHHKLQVPKIVGNLSALILHVIWIIQTCNYKSLELFPLDQFCSRKINVLLLLFSQILLNSWIRSYNYRKVKVTMQQAVGPVYFLTEHTMLLGASFEAITVLKSSPCSSPCASV